MRQPSLGIVLCAMTLVAWKQQTEAPLAQQRALAAASAEVAIAIGATLPLTGSESRIGGFYKEGYDLAFEEANKAGGVKAGDKRMPVKLILLDDTSTQATAAGLADRLINSDKVQFLLGTYSSHLVEAQSVVAEQNGVPYVNGGGGANGIHQRRYKWLLGPLPPPQNPAHP